MIVDCHTHVGKPEHFSEEFLSEMERSWDEIIWGDQDLEAHEAAMAEVDKAIVLAMDAPAVGMVVPNEYVADYVASHADLVGFGSVDPNRSDALERLRHAVNGLDLRGLKVGPIYQDFDPRSPNAMALFAAAMDLEVPVLCHQGTTFLSRARLGLARPHLLDDVAGALPGLTLWIAHLGHPWCDETMAVIRKHERMYADVSALHTRPVQLYFALRSAIEYRVEHKLLFGSDFPFATPTSTLAALREVNEHVPSLPPIPDDVIEGIIYRNTLELIGLE